MTNDPNFWFMAVFVGLYAASRFQVPATRQEFVGAATSLADQMTFAGAAWGAALYVAVAVAIYAALVMGLTLPDLADSTAALLAVAKVPDVESSAKSVPIWVATLLTVGLQTAPGFRSVEKQVRRTIQEAMGAPIRLTRLATEIEESPIKLTSSNALEEVRTDSFSRREYYNRALRAPVDKPRSRYLQARYLISTLRDLALIDGAIRRHVARHDHELDRIDKGFEQLQKDLENADELPGSDLATRFTTLRKELFRLCAAVVLASSWTQSSRQDKLVLLGVRHERKLGMFDVSNLVLTFVITYATALAVFLALWFMFYGTIDSLGIQQGNMLLFFATASLRISFLHTAAIGAAMWYRVKRKNRSLFLARSRDATLRDRLRFLSDEALAGWVSATLVILVFEVLFGMPSLPYALERISILDSLGFALVAAIPAAAAGVSFAALSLRHRSSLMDALVQGATTCLATLSVLFVLFTWSYDWWPNAVVGPRDLPKEAGISNLTLEGWLSNPLERKSLRADLERRGIELTGEISVPTATTAGVTNRESAKALADTVRGNPDAREFVERLWFRHYALIFGGGMAFAVGFCIGFIIPARQRSRDDAEEKHHERRVAVVGGGIAGLSAACELKGRGFAVVVFETEDRAGGRTRALEIDGRSIDIGAQYLEPAVIAGGPYDKQRETWKKKGVVKPWTPAVYRYKRDGSVERGSKREVYVGTPSMSAIAEWMSAGLEVRYRHPIGAIKRTAGGWEVFDVNHHRLETFEFVVVATPPTIDAGLLADQHVSWRADAENVAKVSNPCWVVTAQFADELKMANGDSNRPRFDIARFENSDALFMATRISAKPGREKMNGDLFVLHAHLDWSNDHAPGDATTNDAVIEQLLGEFWRLTGFEPTPQCVQARARYIPNAIVGQFEDHAVGQTEQQLTIHADRADGWCLVDPNGILACGDWCVRWGIGHAWSSGRRAAMVIAEGEPAAGRI